MLLKEKLSDYVIRSVEALKDTTDILSWQKILGTRAVDVPALQIKNTDESLVYDFEPNQRVGELLALLVMAATINTLNSSRKLVLLPAWQRPKQGDAMKQFNGKDSWDGFMFDAAVYKSKQSTPGTQLMPIEIKSLMINPHKESFSSLNDLLDTKMTNFSKHFQEEGSICAVVVFPYVFDPKSTNITFDLKNATQTVNKHVTPKAVGHLLFFDMTDNGDGKTELSIKSHIVSKNPILAENGNIENVTLYKMKLGSYQHKKPKAV